MAFQVRQVERLAVLNACAGSPAGWPIMLRMHATPVRLSLCRSHSGYDEFEALFR
jgi:hypothetical protein